ncbi:acyl-CoA oxidase [Ranunculus cassubicifolius]
MVYVRQTIVADASSALSRAVCIATRYRPETQTRQRRLFPLLATAYAYRFVGEWLKWLYMDVTQRLLAHTCAAGLKSLTTSTTAYISFSIEQVHIITSTNFQPYS